MLQKIRDFIRKVLQGADNRSHGHDLAVQAKLAWDMQSAIETAHVLNEPILMEVQAGGTRHIFSVPGQGPAADWLFDMAAGSWHAALSQAREWAEANDYDLVDYELRRKQEFEE